MFSSYFYFYLILTVFLSFRFIPITRVLEDTYVETHTYKRTYTRMHTEKILTYERMAFALHMMERGRENLIQKVSLWTF